MLTKDKVIQIVRNQEVSGLIRLTNLVKETNPEDIAKILYALVEDTTEGVQTSIGTMSTS